ncbi:ATP-binding protein [Carboxylicivirga sp. RSCT41]|uniref:ATP-binding protein n=1 Tax=Carboxylicivirga agarovorans TaxID=3417570 RepID=UPI003D359440
MKKVLLIYFFIALLFHCIPELYSQNSKADSLQQLIHSSKDDELKVDRLIELSDVIKKTNTEEMKPLLDEARFLAQKLNYSKGLADYYIMKSQYYFHTKEFENGNVLTDSAIVLCQKDELNYTLSSAYYFKGRINAGQEKPQEALKYYNMAIENDSLYPGDKDISSKAYFYKGYANFFIGKRDESARMFEHFIQMKHLSNDYKRLAYSYFMLSIMRSSGTDKNEGDSCLNKAIFYSEKEQDPHLIVTLLNEKAKKLGRAQEYTEALNYFYRALDESKNIQGYHVFEHILHNGIGQIHAIFKNYDEAEYHFKTGLKAAKDKKTTRGIVSLSLRLGKVYESKKEYEQALIYYQDAINIAKEAKSVTDLQEVYRVVARINIRHEKYKEAVAYCDSSLQYSTKYKKHSGYNVALITLAEAKYYLDEIESAKDNLDKFYQYVSQRNDRGNMRDAHILYSKIYEKKNNYKKAYEHYIRHKELNDSVVNEKKVRELAFLESQYEFDKEKEAIQLEQEKKDALQKAALNKQKVIRNATLGGLVLILTLALVTLRSFVQKRKANKILAEQKEKIQSQNKKLLELDEFKQDMTGMIVHDLKNPLNVIINAPQTEPQLALKMTQQSGKQMLNMVLNILDVYKAEAAKISLELANYTFSTILNNAIESVDYLLEQKNITLNVDKNDAYTVRVDGQLIERVMINLLTNAIKYTPLNGSIIIVIRETDSSLKVSISDSGEGISDDKKHLVFDKFAQAKAKRSGSVRSTGLGLTFCKMAIETHGGEIGFESEQGKGATFWFTLQLAEHADEVCSADNKHSKLNDDSKELSIEDFAYLNPFIEQLNAILVYESSEVETILSRIETNDNQALIHWKKSILDCVYTMNQDRYLELLEFKQ